MSSRRLQDVLNIKNCYAEDVFKTSSRRLQDQQMFAGKSIDIFFLSDWVEQRIHSLVVFIELLLALNKVDISFRIICGPNWPFSTAVNISSVESRIIWWVDYLPEIQAVLEVVYQVEVSGSWK